MHSFSKKSTAETSAKLKQPLWILISVKFSAVIMPTECADLIASPLKTSKKVLKSGVPQRWPVSIRMKWTQLDNRISTESGQFRRSDIQKMFLEPGQSQPWWDSSRHYSLSSTWKIKAILIGGCRWKGRNGKQKCQWFIGTLKSPTK